jgi:hypothetical protein
VAAGGESPIAKVLGSALAGVVGVIGGLLIVVLTPLASFLAGGVAEHLQEPSCANPRGLVAVAPKEATGDYQTDAAGSYPPSNLIDGNTSTVWAEGKPGLGLGSTVRFTFTGTPDLKLLCVVNGHGRSWDLYQRNSRARLVSISTAQGAPVDAMLGDAGTPERPAVFQAVKPPQGPTGTLTLTLRSAYAAQITGPRPTYADTCLSEIEFWAASP